MTRLARGELISGKYRIERTLAEGNASCVFQARHVDLGQPVAIKLLRTDPSGRAAVERFRGAARAAARLQGAHVCRVLDVDTHVDGTPLVVMEYLEGWHLGRELEQHGPLPVAAAVRCVLEACDALGAAHAAGIIHCDLKPANLFWATQPDGSRVVKVIGFGVPKAGSAMDPELAALSVTSSAVSSPAYLAPEQLDATQDLDERVDVWALGVVLYELLSGRPPFQGDSLPALVSAVLNGRPRPLSELHAAVPAALDEVIARALRKRREQRYASMAELVAALLPFVDSEPVGARSDVRSVRPAAASGARSQRGAHPREQTLTRSGRSRYGLWLLAFLGAGALTLLGLRWLREPEASAGAPAAQPATETALHGSEDVPRPSGVAPGLPPVAADLAVPAGAARTSPLPATAPGLPPAQGALAAPSTPPVKAAPAPLPASKPAPAATGAVSPALPQTRVAPPAAPADTHAQPTSNAPTAPGGISDFGGRR